MKKSKGKSNSKQLVAGVDLGELGRIVEFITQQGLEEFEYSRGDLHIRIKRPSLVASGSSRPIPNAEILLPPEPFTPPSPASAPPSRETGGESVRTEDLYLVKSPIVGTYYGSPSPGAEPFVKVGDHVKSGQVLCIIEAMKLMNEIESDAEGEVLRVFVDNGQPVEYGEPLFSIRPSRKK